MSSSAPIGPPCRMIGAGCWSGSSWSMWPARWWAWAASAPGPSSPCSRVATSTIRCSCRSRRRPPRSWMISRGPEGLRDVDPAHEPDPEIVRGRAVATVRRERLGPREVMKLDLVEARLRGAGAGYDERLESIAEEVAQVTLRYIESLPPRTLLFLFGDHGFRLPASPDGRTTGPATQGGVSPEEVLVPGQAWLVGGVH